MGFQNLLALMWCYIVLKFKLPTLFKAQYSLVVRSTVIPKGIEGTKTPLSLQRSKLRKLLKSLMDTMTFRSSFTLLVANYRVDPLQIRFLTPFGVMDPLGLLVNHMDTFSE